MGAMRIAVVGVGGIGGYFGGKLAAAGHDVHFVTRGGQAAALREQGIAVTSPAGDFAVAPAAVTDNTADTGEVEAVLLCVKTWQLPAALPALKPLLGADTAVLTLQNGVEAPAEVADFVGRRAVLPGVARIITYLASPGHVVHVGGAGSLTFGEWDNARSARIERLCAAFELARVPAAVPTDIWADLWAKFLFIVPFGGLGTAADAPVGALRDAPGTRRLLVDGMREVERVAMAAGVDLPVDVVDTTLAFLDAQPADGTTSLHRDIRAGRPSELDALTGAVVRIGARTGTPTPINSLLYEVLRLRAEQAGVPTA
jgi:2-dehydropantoate 2-reductase